MTEMQMHLAWMRAWITTRRAETRADESGAGVVEWVVMVGLIVVGAIAIVTIVLNKFKDKATTIPTG